MDIVLIPLAHYLALAFRFEGQIPYSYLSVLLRWISAIVLIHVVVNSQSGVYRRLWMYASVREAILLAGSVGTSTLITFVATALWPTRQRLPLSVVILGGLLTLVLLSTVHYRRRLLAGVLTLAWKSPNPERSRVLTVGISTQAQQLADQLQRDRLRRYEVIGFVDDTPLNWGMNLNGREVLGGSDQIPALVSAYEVDVIVIANDTDNRKDLRRLVSLCQETPAQIKIQYNVLDILDGHARDPLDLRDVRIEDLLGREPAHTDEAFCRKAIEGRVVLVTGACGSIGAELCRQLSRFAPQLLLMLDNNESGLHDLNVELRTQHASLPCRFIVGDITDVVKLEAIFRRYRPEMVFHAAAYKHVPILEEYPEEAIRVNLLGTVLLTEYAVRYGVEQFVFISTDKAVNPCSVMGASKRIGEMWVTAMQQSSPTKFAAVRFGNVIGSRGSVLPTFARQIELGGAVTVTHPDMSRFFMSIPEAVSLILQAVGFSRGGEVFMLDMGDEVRILDLAQRMIRLKGLRIGKDIPIKFIGIRPGEKLHEELWYVEEIHEATPHPRIFSLQACNHHFDRETLLGQIMILVECTRRGWPQDGLRQALLLAAAGDVDGFLNALARVDLLRPFGQPSLPAPRQAQQLERG
jgi:FlaA1/EpsC-like NDP-sugar epimerase